MSHQDLLHQLGQRAREDDAIAADPRWEERARGSPVAEEPGEGGSPAVNEVMREATKPLDDAEIDALTDHVLGSLPAKGAAVVPLFKRRSAVGALAGALALAAGIALFLRAPGIAPVPDYDLDVGRGRASSRNIPAPSGPPAFSPGTEVEILARPHDAVDGAVAVRGALVREGETRAFEPSFQAENGSIRIAGTRETLFGGAPDGAWELWLAVGRREALPARLPPDRPVDAKAVKILRAKVIFTP